MKFKIVSKYSFKYILFSKKSIFSLMAFFSFMTVINILFFSLIKTKAMSTFSFTSVNIVNSILLFFFASCFSLINLFSFLNVHRVNGVKSIELRNTVSPWTIITAKTLVTYLFTSFTFLFMICWIYLLMTFFNFSELNYIISTLSLGSFGSFAIWNLVFAFSILIIVCTKNISSVLVISIISTIFSFNIIINALYTYQSREDITNVPPATTKVNYASISDFDENEIYYKLKLEKSNNQSLQNIYKDLQKFDDDKLWEFKFSSSQDSQKFSCSDLNEEENNTNFSDYERAFLASLYCTPTQYISPKDQKNPGVFTTGFFPRETLNVYTSMIDNLLTKNNEKLDIKVELLESEEIKKITESLKFIDKIDQNFKNSIFLSNNNYEKANNNLKKFTSQIEKNIENNFKDSELLKGVKILNKIILQYFSNEIYFNKGLFFFDWKIISNEDTIVRFNRIVKNSNEEKDEKDKIFIKENLVEEDADYIANKYSNFSETRRLYQSIIYNLIVRSSISFSYPEKESWQDLNSNNVDAKYKKAIYYNPLMWYDLLINYSKINIKVEDIKLIMNTNNFSPNQYFSYELEYEEYSKWTDYYEIKKLEMYSNLPRIDLIYLMIYLISIFIVIISFFIYTKIIYL